MKNARPTFNEILNNTAKENAETLMKKARLANRLAKRFQGKKRRQAYSIKADALCSLIKSLPNKITVRKDIRLTEFVVVELKLLNQAYICRLQNYKESKIMKRIITIDIETLPIDAPVESNLFWEDEKGFRNTALDGTLGRILCIGYTEQDEFGKHITHGCFGWNEFTSSFETNESLILQDFWEYLKSFNLNRDLLIGHNIMNFDLPFIVQRSRLFGIQPTIDFSFYKYQKSPIFDTMLQWDCWTYRKEGSTSLKKLAFAFGLKCPKKLLQDTSVYDAYLAGEYQKLYDYCLADVKTTLLVWRKMNFRQTKIQTMALLS